MLMGAFILLSVILGIAALVGRPIPWTTVTISAFLLAATIYVITIEEWHKTLVAITFGSGILFITELVGRHWPEAFDLMPYSEAFTRYVDWNVIFLLFGMMCVAGVLKKTGIFEVLAAQTLRISKGNNFAVLIFLSAITAFVSALLDNVTTMIFMAPVALAICRHLGLKPTPILISMALTSNVGGTATLIGDPPNIMIGSFAGLTFMDFILQLTPVILVVWLVTTSYHAFAYRRELSAKSSPKAIDASEWTIKDRKLTVVSLIIVGTMMLLFGFHSLLHLETGLVALFGAAILLLAEDILWMRRHRGVEPKDKSHGIVDVLHHDIEWSTLFFFIFLFVIVGACDRSGLLAIIGRWLAETFAGHPQMMLVAILWVSAVTSAFVDNIPFTATMLPIIKIISGQMQFEDPNQLYWALSLGACLGGNGTYIGASANVVTVGLLAKEGIVVGFKEFAKVGAPSTFLACLVSTIWLLWLEPMGSLVEWAVAGTLVLVAFFWGRQMLAKLKT